MSDNLRDDVLVERARKAVLEALILAVRADEERKRLVDESARLREEIARLRALLAECADVVEAEVRDAYGWPVHSVNRSRFQRDMDLVHRARTAAQGKGPSR